MVSSSLFAYTKCLLALNEQINFEIKSYETFSGLLDELFPNGQITREGIVVLFFFCSDLAFRAYSAGTFSYFKRIIGWSLRFIFFNICSWVQSNGGWVCQTYYVLLCFESRETGQGEREADKYSAMGAKKMDCIPGQGPLNLFAQYLSALQVDFLVVGLISWAWMGLILPGLQATCLPGNE